MDHNIIPLVALSLPILAILVTGAVAFIAMFLKYKRRKEAFALYHQERMAAIDKGVDLPPLPEAFLMDSGRPYRTPLAHRPLLIGLVLLLGGLSLLLGLSYRAGSEQAIWGLVPSAVGLAFLIYYFAVGRKEALNLPSAPPQPPEITPQGAHT
jgi:hypothetical protein